MTIKIKSLKKSSERIRFTLVDRINWMLDSYKNVFKFNRLPFPSPLRYKKVTYLFRKPKAIAIECQHDIGWILTLMYQYITKRGVLLGLEGLHWLKSTLGLKFNPFYSYFMHPYFTLCILKFTLCISKFTLCIRKLLYAPIVYFMHPKI